LIVSATFRICRLSKDVPHSGRIGSGDSTYRAPFEEQNFRRQSGSGQSLSGSRDTSPSSAIVITSDLCQVFSSWRDLLVWVISFPSKHPIHRGLAHRHHHAKKLSFRPSRPNEVSLSAAASIRLRWPSSTASLKLSPPCCGPVQLLFSLPP